MELNVPSEMKKVESKPVESQVKAPSLALLGLPAVASRAVGEGREVPAPVTQASETQEVFIELDKRDEDQIVQQLSGGYIEDFVYEYCKYCKWPKGIRPASCDHETVMDLSWIGIQEATRQMSITVKPGERWLMIDRDNNVKVLSESKAESPGVTVHEFEDYVRVIVRASDPQKGIERLGVAQQSKLMKTSNGMKGDEFYFQKALSKAERNALRQLMPQAVMKEWIQKYLAKKNGQATTQPTGPTQPTKASEQKLQALLEASRMAGIEVSMDMLRSKIKTEVAVDYVLNRVRSGDLEKYRTFMFGEQTLLPQQPQGDTTGINL